MTRLCISLSLLCTVSFIAIASVSACDLGGEGLEELDGSRSMIFWHPGQTRVMDFYVENKSPITDTIVIEVTLSDPNWTYSLNRTLFEDVPPWTTVYFSFSLTAPMNVMAGDFVEVNLTARSLTTNITESLNWRSYVIVERDIKVIELGEPYYELNNTSSIRTEVRVSNIGDLPFNVTMDSRTSEDSETIDDRVRVTIDPAEFELLRGEETNVSVFIEVLSPTLLRADSEYGTFIWARILEDKSVWSGLRIDWGVAEIFEASVDPERSSHRILPNEEVSVEISLSQSTNNHTGHTWHLTTNNISIGWQVTIREGSYEINGSGSFTVDMAVGAPGNALPGAYTVVELLFMCDQFPGKVLTSVVTIDVEEVHFVQFFVSPGYQRFTVEDMFNGTTARYDVTMYNKGNVQEYLAIEFLTDGSRGTDTLTIRSPRDAGVMLQPYSDYTFFFEVEVDRLTPAKEYWINVHFLWDHVPIPPDRVVLEVDPFMDITCSMEIAPEPVINPNLPDPEVTLSIANTGNLRVPYILQWSVLPVEGNIRVRGASDRMSDLHIVQSGEINNHTFRLFIYPPDAGPMDDGSFQMTVLHYNGHTLWNGTVEYSVVYPDLSIVGYEFDAPVRRGEQNVMFVAVENRGDGTSPATSIVLISEVMGEELNMTDVPELAPGGSIVLPLGFRLTAEEDIFVVEVDPHHEVYEHGYGPNSINMTVSDPAEPPEGPGPTSSFLLGLLLVLGLSGMGYVAYRLVRRRLDR